MEEARSPEEHAPAPRDQYRCSDHGGREIELPNRQCPPSLLSFEISGKRKIVTQRRCRSALLQIISGIIMPDRPIGQSGALHGVLPRQELQCEQSLRGP
ncbi:hypothetical protein [Mesorhizobium sp. M0579]|uniref:hypothetical protein n=1 Tax=Mesorhizobium sp. M0579 TaxID=2956962 RepID=UPI00333B2865